MKIGIQSKNQLIIGATRRYFTAIFGISFARNSLIEPQRRDASLAPQKAIRKVLSFVNGPKQLK